MRRTESERRQELHEASLVAMRLSDLMSDPIVGEFFSNVRSRLIDQMINAPIEDDQGRRNAAIELRIANNLETYLRDTVKIGMRATDELRRYDQAEYQ
jgi:hypothetical protein